MVRASQKARQVKVTKEEEQKKVKMTNVDDQSNIKIKQRITEDEQKQVKMTNVENSAVPSRAQRVRKHFHMVYPRNFNFYKNYLVFLHLCQS